MPRSSKLIFALLLVGPAVFAQPAAPPPAEPPPAAEADIPVRQRATLSPQDMMTQAKDYRERMTELVARIESMVEQARRSKDIIRVNCLLDRLAQIKGHVSTVDRALQSLQEAVTRNDEGASFHEYNRITIVHQKVQVLAAEAEACIGEDLSYVGATRVDVEVEGVPDEDFADPRPPSPAFDRPPEASPFR